MLPFSKQETAK